MKLKLNIIHIQKCITKMKKYLLVSHKYDNLKRGAYITSNRLVDRYRKHLDYKTDLEIQDLNELNYKYKKIIFVTQVLSNYNIKLNLTKMKKLNHLIMLRSTQNLLLYNSCSNGFHYFKSYKNIKNFIPFITDFPLIEHDNNNIPCLGFYIRRTVTPDSLSYIKDFLKNLSQKVDVYVMGNPTPEFLKYKCVNTYKHTYNNKEFFKSITHYIYPSSKIFQDPFPNSILEAVHTGAQIVLPDILGRLHMDGIDDIKECIKWHNKFDSDIIYDNSDCILNGIIFDKFYLNLFNNDFEYKFDRSEYKYFSDWIEKEVI